MEMSILFDRAYHKINDLINAHSQINASYLINAPPTLLSLYMFFILPFRRQKQVYCTLEVAELLLYSVC